MKSCRIISVLSIILLCLSATSVWSQSIVFCGRVDNDLYVLLQKEGWDIQRYDNPEQAIQQSKPGMGVIISASSYPTQKTPFSDAQYLMAKQKKLKVYLEYPQYIPGISVPDTFIVGKLERGVISSDFFGKSMPEMSLLGLNDCHLYHVKVEKPLISFAKVAGFAKADYGLTGTDVYPLLFRKDNMLIAMSCLTNFKQGRFEPNVSWKIVWEQLAGWLTQNKKVSFSHWSSDPAPSYTADAVFPADARKVSINRGSEWFFNSRLLIHPSWKSKISEFETKPFPFGPSIGPEYLVGDGSHGILEGHASRIFYNGKQQYRYWIRNDVQGEVSFSLAAAGSLLNNEKYRHVSENLIDYIFYTSIFRSGARSDKKSPTYGLLGWIHVHPDGFYNEDNSRAMLGVIGASAFMNNNRWNQLIIENILANFRICSKQGFIGNYHDQADIIANGWKHYHDRDYVNIHPHFESWMWACYLWLYGKTNYQPLLDRARTAIRLTMEAYPDKWTWTNGIQQERARMILPLSWLVRVDDTAEHRQWLDTVVKKLLESQQSNGAIREELGDGPGYCGRTISNETYGVYEASLISNNGDPAADMLYTNNFAFFALNEAAHVTGNEDYKKAVAKLSDFLVRIQIQSDSYADLDGAWFRAFDFNHWNYWGSNADNGWGAWCTLAGWIQSWIIATQTLVENNQSYWDITRKLQMEEPMKKSLWMLEE